MKTCNKCSRNVKMHVSCFRCCNVYHSRCFLKVPTIYVNEKGNVFCCQNPTSKYNSYESKSQTQENMKGKCSKEFAYGTDGGLENNKLTDNEHEKDDTPDAGFKEKEILEEVDGSGDDFVCSFCEVKLNEEESYRQHLKLCEKNRLRLNKIQDADERVKKLYKCALSKKSFKCGKCEFETMYKGNLAIHIRSRHTDKEKKYKCDNCTYSTHIKETLKQHMRIHSEEKRFNCIKCEYAAASKNQLNVHVWRTHNSISTLFQCDKCKFETIYRCNLAKHILARHSNVEKKYKCNDCTFSSHRKQDLTKHTRIHSTENRFKCDQCEYATPSKKLLSLHISKTHNFTLFKCDVCEFETAYKRSLGAHVLLKHYEVKKKIQV